jgi:hypothetical protein
MAESSTKTNNERWLVSIWTLRDEVHFFLSIYCRPKQQTATALFYYFGRHLTVNGRLHKIRWGGALLSSSRCSVECEELFILSSRKVQRDCDKIYISKTCHGAKPVVAMEYASRQNLCADPDQGTLRSRSVRARFLREILYIKLLKPSITRTEKLGGSQVTWSWSWYFTPLVGLWPLPPLVLISFLFAFHNHNRIPPTTTLFNGSPQVYSLRLQSSKLQDLHLKEWPNTTTSLSHLNTGGFCLFCFFLYHTGNTITSQC